MDFRMVTVLLIFFSLFMHANAHDEPRNEHARFHKHSGAFKHRRHFQKVPEEVTINEKVSENLTKTEKEMPKPTIHRKMNILDKNEIEIVNSAEFNSQIEDPFEVSASNIDENCKSNEYELVKKKKTLTEPKQIIKELKELVFVSGIYDFLNLLDNIVLDEPEEVISQGEDQNSIRIYIPEEPKGSVIEFRKELGKGSLYQESNELSSEESKKSLHEKSKDLLHEESKELLHEENKKLLHKESMDSENTNQRNMKEKEISGEEITSKRVITKENRRFGKQHKDSGGEINEEYANTKPNTIKKHKLLKDKDARRHIEVEKHNENKDFKKSITTKIIEKHTINKNNISSVHKKIEEEKEKVKGIPTKDTNKKKDITEVKRRYGKNRKHLSEEIDKGYTHANTKPNTIKNILVNGNKDSEKSISTKTFEKHIINKNNISSLRNKNEKEKEENEVIPTKSVNRRNDISKSNRNIQKSIVTQNYNPSARKQLKEKLITEDLSKSGNFQDSMELEELSINTEPETIDKLITYIGYKFPKLAAFLNFYRDEKLIADLADRKYDEQEDETVRKYIIFTNQKNPSQRRLEESVEIIENTDNGLKPKSTKVC